LHQQDVDPLAPGEGKFSSDEQGGFFSPSTSSGLLVRAPVRLENNNRRRRR
jgi:hypothetical protein